MSSPDTTRTATGRYNENAIKIWDAKAEELTTVKHEETVFDMNLR
jgi:hypothetical protein